MELKIKTEKLKELVSRAIKGASNNKLIPITSYMLIELKDNVLTFVTTDGTNSLYIRENKVEGQDFYIVVQADQFSKLISRMTCDFTKLEIKENSLLVIGNGTYMLDIPMEDDGENVQFPDPLSAIDIDVDQEKEVNLSTIKVILSSCKNSLLQTMEDPARTHYYVGDRVIATDGEVVASLEVDLLEAEILIPPEVMNLLDVMSCEKFNAYIAGNTMVFSSPDCVVYGVTTQQVEDYEVDNIKEFMKTKYKSSCKVNRNAFLSLLDRIGLFVNSLDDDQEIRFTFTKDGINVESKRGNGVEVIQYLESNKFKPFTCSVDIRTVINALKSVSGDGITLEYGEEQALKFVDGSLSQMVALLEEVAEEE